MEFNRFDVSTKELVWDDPAAWLEGFGIGPRGPFDVIDSDITTLSAAADNETLRRVKRRIDERQSGVDEPGVLAHRAHVRGGSPARRVDQRRRLCLGDHDRHGSGGRLARGQKHCAHGNQPRQPGGTGRHLRA